MFSRLIKVLISFLLACLAVGLTKVLFATTPSVLASLPPDEAADKLDRPLLQRDPRHSRYRE